MPEAEPRKLTKEKRADIRKRMDELGARWAAPAVDQSMMLGWMLQQTSGERLF
jgi:hypothetical protein